MANISSYKIRKETKCERASKKKKGNNTQMRLIMYSHACVYVVYVNIWRNYGRIFQKRPKIEWQQKKCKWNLK